MTRAILMPRTYVAPRQGPAVLLNHRGMQLPACDEGMKHNLTVEVDRVRERRHCGGMVMSESVWSSAAHPDCATLTPLETTWANCIPLRTAGFHTAKFGALYRSQVINRTTI